MKTIAKRLCAILLAGLLAAAVLPTSAFANVPSPLGQDSKTFVTPVVTAAVAKINERIKAKGEYAKLTGPDENGGITVTIYKGEYPLVGNGKDDIGTYAWFDIFGTLVNYLHENRTAGKYKVKSIVGTAYDNTCTQPQTCIGDRYEIDFDQCAGELPVDNHADIQSFIQSMYNPGSYEDHIDVLNGQTLTFKISTTATTQYAPAMYNMEFKMAPTLDVTEENEGEGENQVEITEDETLGKKTLTGDGLTNGNKAVSVTELESKFESVGGEYSVEITKADDTKLEDSALVGTGSKIKLKDSEGTVIDEIVVIVKGDVSGDGSIDITDATEMLDVLAKTIKAFDGAYKQASLVAGNDTMTITDVTTVLDIAGTK